MDSRGLEFIRSTLEDKYSYNFEWLSRPIIQYPQDMVAMQQLIWRIKPDLILETGIAHGGSLIMSASMLALIDLCEAIEAGHSLNPKDSRRKVIGVDIDIRSHNREALEAHPMINYIDMFEGSSIEPEMVARICEAAEGYNKILVCLDSNHTHDHVMAELESYAPLTSQGSYCVVFDTIIEDLEADDFPDRPWGPGNNPKTAVRKYLQLLATGSRLASDGEALDFEIDRKIESEILITVAPDGFLRRI